ncbi:hypothetical protein [Evansella tamaricis]|uniref:Uncharacterized protein n=1 Tax=Evansella tamaricis TaxID=2069301 RepID=A0ABS6JBW6_9BACI|nr:hypothetical protein [Evansella tamaricis]MBU9711166.1 hypothetical protein [Evansella tamaricis]
MGVEELTDLMIEIKKMGERDLNIETDEMLTVIRHKLMEHLDKNITLEELEKLEN